MRTRASVRQVSPIRAAANRRTDNCSKFALLQSKAWLWIRFEASLCGKVTCNLLPWRKHYDWVRGTTDWMQRTSGQDPAGLFWGKHDAVSHFDENVKALEID